LLKGLPRNEALFIYLSISPYFARLLAQNCGVSRATVN